MIDEQWLLKRSYQKRWGFKTTLSPWGIFWVYRSWSFSIRLATHNQFFNDSKQFGKPFNKYSGDVTILPSWLILVTMCSFSCFSPPGSSCPMRSSSKERRTSLSSRPKTGSRRQSQALNRLIVSLAPAWKPSWPMRWRSQPRNHALRRMTPWKPKTTIRADQSVSLLTLQYPSLHWLCFPNANEWFITSYVYVCGVS